MPPKYWYPRPEDPKPEELATAQDWERFRLWRLFAFPVAAKPEASVVPGYNPSPLPPGIERTPARSLEQYIARTAERIAAEKTSEMRDQCNADAEEMLKSALGGKRAG